MKICVKEESIPEDFLGFFTFKCAESIPASRADEIDAVVSVPMLKSVTAIEELIGRFVTVPKAPHEQLKYASLSGCATSVALRNM